MRRGALRSLAVSFGTEVRGNDYYRTHYPEVVETATQKSLAKAFSTQDRSADSDPFDAEMARYVADPFRGAVERHILGPDQTALSIEVDAARKALAAAGLAPGDLDLILCASWLPQDFVAPGDAVWIARELETQAPAWNIETACSSGLAILQMAHAMIAAGLYERILVVVSSTNSRHTADNDTLGWISSDAAAAAVLVPDDDGAGVLGTHAVNTAKTCGVFVHDLVASADGVHGHVQMNVGSAGTRLLRETTGPELIRRCCMRAAERAQLVLDEIDFFGFSTPLAWSSSLCLRALEVPAERTLNLFPSFANLGAPFPLIYLYFGAQRGLLSPGSLGLVYTVGSVASAGAMVIRWGHVELAS